MTRRHTLALLEECGPAVIVALADENTYSTAARMGEVGRRAWQAINRAGQR